MKRLFITLLAAAASLLAIAGWDTHFSYSDVQQIAVTPDRVYGLADGSLFSVDKRSELLTLYTAQSGLHSTNIVCIGYDDRTGKLILCYSTGKIDLLTPQGVEYVADLYNKDMTASKRTNNITVHQQRAYLAMPFGIVTFDLNKHQFIDTYYIGDNAAEVNVLDVAFRGDSIYAFSDSRLFSASLDDYLMDYRNWHREPLSARIPRDADKGVSISEQDGTLWQAAGSQGILRTLPATGRQVAYCPNGPANNIPCRLTVGAGDRLYVVPGDRWADRVARDAYVSIYGAGQWTIIPNDYLKQQSGMPDVWDFMNVTEDPADPAHFYATSYGMGVWEFRGTTLWSHFSPANSSLQSAAPSNPAFYTRNDGACFDAQGNVFFPCAKRDIAFRRADGSWGNIPLVSEGSTLDLETPGRIFADNRTSNRYWIISHRSPTGLILFDHNGTLDNADDDYCLLRTSWLDNNGRIFSPERVRDVMQDRAGNIWLGTDQGVAVIDAATDFTTSSACRRLDIMLDGAPLLDSEEVMAFAQDTYGRIWIGSLSTGVYVLSEQGDSLLAHYMPDNSAMPSAGVLSLAACRLSSRVYIGTGAGLVSYDEDEHGAGIMDRETGNEPEDTGIMGQWQVHSAYTVTEEVEDAGDRVYVKANGALYSVGSELEIDTYDRTTGLNGSTIAHIAYDKTTHRLLIVYNDGKIDLMDDRGGIVNMPDLYLASQDRTIEINTILLHRSRAYLGMNFGIVVLNLRKQEVEDTYYIGEDGGEVSVTALTVWGDSLYAAAEETLYSVAILDNAADYSVWHRTRYATTLTGVTMADDRLYLLRDSMLYCRRSGAEQPLLPAERFAWIDAKNNRLVAYSPTRGLVMLQDDTLAVIDGRGYPVLRCARQTDGTWWLALGGYGCCRITPSGAISNHKPNGPYTNDAYRMTVADGRLMVAPGGRWAAQYMRPGHIPLYENNNWSVVGAWLANDKFNTSIYDVMSFAVNPNDKTHFFATTYGHGVVEFRNDQPYAHFTEGTPGCTLVSAVARSDKDYLYYVRTDGVTLDDQGNLWVLNTEDRAYNVNILTNALSDNPSARRWVAYNVLSGGSKIAMETPGEILIDSRHPNWKWIPECRAATGLTLLDDRGTPLDPSDDHALKRSSFVDQNGNILGPEFIYCLAQDHEGNIWIGTSAGPLLITHENFFTSNLVRRVLINRKDGSGLGDYLLVGERINTIAIDGANRKWIGTADNGIFVISDDISPDGIETVAHFTQDNSSLPSSEVLAIAINPQSGEVFASTAKGIASYRSDAAEAKTDMSGAYAFPNPVRRNYTGLITITGLMENTVVNIVDVAGNLVCKTRSNGAIATWDGRDQHGRRVATGVYSAFCNSADGNGHTVVKIMILNR